MAYLDYAATAPMVAPAREAWLEASMVVGNASAVHTAGRAARSRLEDAREQIASILGVDAPEVIFTSGGTEADNLALSGGGLILTSELEHPAISQSAALRGTVRTIPTLPSGVVDVDAVSDLLDGVSLVSVMAANNETGIIQPIGEIAALAAERGIPMHSDAVQAAGWIDLPHGIARSLSGHKLGGPTGIGVLVAPRDFPLAMIEGGGGQERKVRSGTLNLAGALGMAAALAHRVEIMADLRTRLAGYVETILAAGVACGGRQSGGDVDRLPHIAHLIFDGCDPEALIVGLDMAGISASLGSACSAGVYRPSHVLEAMGVDSAAVRFSLGEDTSDEDIDSVVTNLARIVEVAR